MHRHISVKNHGWSSLRAMTTSVVDGIYWRSEQFHWIKPWRLKTENCTRCVTFDTQCRVSLLCIVVRKFIRRWGQFVTVSRWRRCFLSWSLHFSMSWRQPRRNNHNCVLTRKKNALTTSFVPSASLDSIRIVPILWGGYKWTTLRTHRPRFLETVLATVWMP